MMSEEKGKTTPFTSYQILLIGIFSFMLFTIVVDYMTLPALSAILLPELQITTKQFGFLVSVYAFSAGASGFLATGFADRFDRKKLLLVYYSGFLLGMVLCAVANSLLALLIARAITGIFGGVVASICFAIVADVFEIDQRGRVMGYVQMAFAASHIAGLPLALYLATNFHWHLTYWVFFILGLIIMGIIFLKVNAINEHLHIEKKENILTHSLNIVGKSEYWTVFSNNVLLVLGDVMFMTFYAAYSTNNLGLSLDDLPLLFAIGGMATIVFSPIMGRLSDKYGKLKVFTIGTSLAITMIAIFSYLGSAPLWLIVILHTLLFIGINARMIASTALATVVPKQQDRGAFMALDSSFQQIAGGVGATAAGLIVYQLSDGMIEGYPTLALVVISMMLGTIGLMYTINRIVGRKK
jgi:predicted MFS family arabinose efflux permease